MTMLGVFYKGGTDNYGLHSCSFDGTTWRGGADVSGQSGGINAKTDKALGACLYENRLYVAYKGWTSDDLYISVFDGTTWAGDVKIRDMPGGIDARSSAPPTLIVYNDLLHIFYKAHDGDQVRAAWFDGLQWAGGSAIADLAGGVNPRTDTGPCAAAFGGKLYLFYMGAGGIKLYSCWCDGGTWGGGQAIGDQAGGIDPWSDDPPTAAVFGGTLFLVYRGAGSQSIFVSRFDGRTWSGDKAISDEPGHISPQTDSGPSLIVFQNRLGLVYKGKYTESLYVAWYDGANWSGDVSIDSQTGGIGPSSDIAPALCLLPNPVPPRAAPASNHAMDMVPKTIGGPGAPAVKKGTVSIDFATPTGSKDNQLAVDQSDLADPLISDINLIGTHDSAAIRDLWPRQFLYACQNLSIGRQLDLGIRVLDVRLEMLHDSGQFTIYTCHGDHDLGPLHSNRYQTFQSLLDECKEFLRVNPREFIVMLLRVDYWNNTPDQTDAYLRLSMLLGDYPIINNRADMPRRSEAAGRIYLINRMNDDLALGVPIDWTFNTDGQSMPAARTGRNFEVYVQDRCDIVASDTRQHKLTRFWTTATHKTQGMLLLNFGSANTNKVLGVYIYQALISRIGALSAADRPRNFGWSLFDFPETAVQTDKYGSITVVDLIKDAATGYSRFKDKFTVTEDGRAQLIRWETRP